LVAAPFLPGVDRSNESTRTRNIDTDQEAGRIQIRQEDQDALPVSPSSTRRASETEESELEIELEDGSPEGNPGDIQDSQEGGSPAINRTNDQDVQEGESAEINQGDIQDSQEASSTATNEESIQELQEGVNTTSYDLRDRIQIALHGLQSAGQAAGSLISQVGQAQAASVEMEVLEVQRGAMKAISMLDAYMQLIQSSIKNASKDQKEVFKEAEAVLSSIEDRASSRQDSSLRIFRA
ncbi:hypothetical protein, partial [Candidatus Similichlamydia epinepheli]|uniref:hypothetical protein n=1 Tax=Candidatus Similichlamydia epinepheli TaxID=1903953 RepID=UPI0013008FB9